MAVRKEKAFTLIELLVVVAIISLLMSILLPSLGKAREQAKSLKCLANLRQIGSAALIYADQNNGMLPPANHSSTKAATGDETRWTCRLQYVITGQGTPVNPPYGTSVKDCDPTWIPNNAFFCPNSNYNTGIDRGRALSNYGWNALMGVNVQTPQPPFSYKMTRLSMPQELILVGDRWGKNAGGSEDKGWAMAPPEPVAATGLGAKYPIATVAPATDTYPHDAIRANHGGERFNANFVFGDAHAESIQPEKTWRIPRARNEGSNSWMVF